MLRIRNKAGDVLLYIISAILFIAGGDWLQYAPRASPLFLGIGQPSIGDTGARQGGLNFGHCTIRADRHKGRYEGHHG